VSLVAIEMISRPACRSCSSTSLVVQAPEAATGAEAGGGKIRVLVGVGIGAMAGQRREVLCCHRREIRSL
jgi:hypothetical protein